MYYQDQDYDGMLEAYGGFGNDEYGPAGTIYHHQMPTNKTSLRRSLYVSNNGHGPQTKRVNEVTLKQSMGECLLTCSCFWCA